MWCSSFGKLWAFFSFFFRWSLLLAGFGSPSPTWLCARMARRGRGVSAGHSICSRGGDGEGEQCARRPATGRKQATAAGCSCATENAAGDGDTWKHPISDGGMRWWARSTRSRRYTLLLLVRPTHDDTERSAGLVDEYIYTRTDGRTDQLTPPILYRNRIEPSRHVLGMSCTYRTRQRRRQVYS